jgi:hypothetical protein
VVEPALAHARDRGGSGGSGPHSSTARLPVSSARRLLANFVRSRRLTSSRLAAIPCSKVPFSLARPGAERSRIRDKRPGRERVMQGAWNKSPIYRLFLSATQTVGRRPFLRGVIMSYGVERCRDPADEGSRIVACTLAEMGSRHSRLSEQQSALGEARPISATIRHLDRSDLADGMNAHPACRWVEGPRPPQPQRGPGVIPPTPSEVLACYTALHLVMRLPPKWATEGAAYQSGTPRVPPHPERRRATENAPANVLVFMVPIFPAGRGAAIGG